MKTQFNILKGLLILIRTISSNLTFDRAINCYHTPGQPPAFCCRHGTSAGSYTACANSDIDPSNYGALNVSRPNFCYVGLCFFLL